MLKFKIENNEANQKVFKFVKKYLNNAPLSLIYKTFRKKDVKVNGKRVNEDYILKENDEVQIYLPKEFTDLSSKKESVKRSVAYANSKVYLCGRIYSVQTFFPQSTPTPPQLAVMVL